MDKTDKKELVELVNMKLDGVMDETKDAAAPKLPIKKTDKNSAKLNEAVDPDKIEKTPKA